MYNKCITNITIFFVLNYSVKYAEKTNGNYRRSNNLLLRQETRPLKNLFRFIRSGKMAAKFKPDAELATNTAEPRTCRKNDVCGNIKKTMHWNLLLFYGLTQMVPFVRYCKQKESLYFMTFASPPCVLHCRMFTRWTTAICILFCRLWYKVKRFHKIRFKDPISVTT